MNNNKNYRVMKFFEAVDKSCKGKGCVKIDFRGNRGFITVNLENLGDGKTLSEVYLFKNKKEKIKIGPINSRRGRLQKSIILNSKDDPIENYNICGIVINDKIHMYAPIFSPIKTAQIDNLLEDEVDAVVQEVDEEPENVVEENTDQSSNISHDDDDNHIHEQDNPNNETNEDLSCDEKQENQVNQYDYQYDRITYKDYQKDINDENVEKQGAKKYSSDYERNLYNLLEKFEPIKPLAHDIRSIKWWKVLYDENSIYKGFLPYFNQIISTYYPYPMANHITSCQTLLKQYGYYIFGIYEKDGKILKFVYGLPGKFTRDQQPYKGVTGFKNWSYKNNDIPGDYGYWLAFIDADTGAITDAPDIEE